MLSITAKSGRCLIGAALAALSTGCGAPGPATLESTTDTAREARLSISTLPSPVRTVTEGVFREADSTSPGGYAETQNLTWLFHLVLTSNETVPLQIDQVDARFMRAGRPLWQERLYRDYLTRLEWLSGEFAMTPRYHLTKVLHGQEVAGRT